MQNALTVPGWLWNLFSAMGGAGLLAVLYKFYLLWLYRKQRAAEVHESQARIKLTEADANSKDVDSSIKAAEVIIKSAQKISEQQQAIGKLEFENKLLVEQNEHMKALLKLHKITYEGNGRAH